MKKAHVPVVLALTIGASAALGHDRHAAASYDTPVAARYETVGVACAGRIAARSDWYLVRTATRIETAGEGRAEIWERSERGDISMRRVFRDDELILEYHAGDLRAMNKEPQWRALGSVIDPGLLARFERTGSKKVLGREAQVYRSGTGRDRIEVWWIEELSLPAVVKRAGEAGTYTMRLIDVRGTTPSSWPLASHWQIEGFRIVDAADLGDLEHDAVLKRLMRVDASGGAGFKSPHTHD